jgi:quercetin 2,3-dioxygenase
VTAVDADVLEEGTSEPCAGPEFERLEAREADVGGITVRRALPKRHRRTIGAWCFVDHFGPTAVGASAPMQIGPHPHIGLQTVTWLVAGEALHRDSLGVEQLIRPGQLNLMTAGRGVSHAEESPTGSRGELHGAQLWVAQPDATRHGAPAFEHHEDLPRLELGGVVASVLVGRVGEAVSPARADTPLTGVALEATGGAAVVPLDPSHEHGVVVLDGSLEVEGQEVRPGTLAYLGLGRDELALGAVGPAHALLLGGAPFEAEPLMWWNFVARRREEIEEAWDDWETGADRFGAVASELERIAAPGLQWRR